MESTKIVILAAGKGTRLASLGFGMPKPLIPILGKPMIQHLFDAINESGIDNKPIIVTASDNVGLFKKALGNTCEYVVQNEQLGTGHAVMTAKDAFSGSEHVMILYGDHPTISAKTIRQLLDEQKKSGATITMTTVKFPDFNDWRRWFYDFSRIIRDDHGQIIRDVQKKDATPEELKVTEVNPCYYVFRTDWLLDNIKNLKNDNMQKEYYLTDLIRFAFDQKEKIHSYIVEDPIEAVGVNTPEQLSVAEEVLSKRK